MKLGSPTKRADLFRSFFVYALYFDILDKISYNRFNLRITMHTFLTVFAIIGLVSVSFIITWLILFANQISKNGWEQ